MGTACYAFRTSLDIIGYQVSHNMLVCLSMKVMQSRIAQQGKTGAPVVAIIDWFTTSINCSIGLFLHRGCLNKRTIVSVYSVQLSLPLH